MKVFFDTNVWIELLAIRVPEKEHEKKQAINASNTLKELKKNDECIIITCKEQLCEIIQAVLKIQMRAYNKIQKEQQTHAGVGSVKEFRKSEEFETAKMICQHVIEDMNQFASVDSEFNYEIENIVDDLNVADINDSMYYHYCNECGISLFTFDQDLVSLDTEKNTVKLLA